jgi:hypothetical protein
MRSAKGGVQSSGSGRTAFRRKLSALLALALLAGGCASQRQQRIWNTDADEWNALVGQKFADVVDATDKIFGEPRVEDREQIARAKVGVKAKSRERQDTDWTIPSNFRIPLPSLGRQSNVFVDFTSDADASNLSQISPAAEQSGSALSATVLKRVTDTLDFGATLGIHGGPDVGPELFLRYERRRDPWLLFGEERGYWRTDNGWGGRTILNLDYKLPSNNSFVRFANKAEYYQELHEVDFKSGLLYRRRVPGEVALSAETGIEYNPYTGDPGKDIDTDPEHDDDNAYARVRMIGRLWRPWIEWEVMPGYYYYWEHDQPGTWGIDVRLSVIFEAFLSGPE